MKDFFVSYTGVDRAWAEWIAWELEEAGYSTVLQAWDFAPGTNFVLEMDRATRSAERTLLVLSQAFMKSAFTSPEWAAAFTDDPDGTRKKIVPVRIEAFTVPGLLKTLVYIDLVGKDEGGARNELLKGVQGGRKKPQDRPAFPRPVRGEKAEFPPKRTRTWDVPYPRNPHFTGRENFLKAIDHALGEKYPVALTGMPGVGKTQLVAEFAYQHRSRYDHVWWATASETPTLVSYYRQMAETLQIARAGDHFDTTWPQLRGWLEEHGRWLMVFDAAASPEVLINHLPPLGRGHLLITSNYQTWSRVARSIDIGPFSSDESLEFFTRRATAEVANSPIATELGNHPLAMDQAAAYIQTVGLTSSAYLSRMKTDLVSLLDAETPVAYPRSVASAVDLSLEEVEKKHPPARLLLTLLSMFAAEPVPREVVDALASELDQPEYSGRLAVDKAVSALAQMSLLTATSDRLSMHALTKRLVRARLDPSQTGKMLLGAGGCLSTLLRRISPQDPEAWEQCNELMPHCLSVGRALLAEGPDEDLHTTLGAVHVDFVATYLDAIGDPEAAERLLLEALEEAETKSSAQGAKAVLYAHLGTLEVRGGKAQDAEQHLSTALAQDGLASDNQAYARAVVLHRLGTAYSALERLPEAEACLHEALLRFVEGNDEDEAASVNHSMGIVMARVGNLEGAQGQFQQALDFLRGTSSPDQHRLASTLSNLASVLSLKGEYAAAEETMTEALRIIEDTYGAAHPRVIPHLTNLASLQISLREFDDAQVNLERAIEIDQAIFGSRHPSLIIRLLNLSALHSANERYDDAEKLLDQALEIGLEHYDESAQPIRDIKRSMATLQIDRGHVENGVALLEEILSKDLEQLPPRHPTIAETLTTLGLAMSELGNFEDALVYYTQALDIEVETLQAPHRKIAVELMNLGWSWMALGRRSDALNHLHAALEMFEEMNDPHVERTEEVRHAVAGLRDALEAD